jgi:hypothetical protein
VSIGGMTFGSVYPHIDDAGSEWVFSAIDGWDNSGSGVRRADSDRPQSHGAFDLPGWRTGRSVGLSGTVLCNTRAAAASIVQRMNSLLAAGQAGEISVADDDLPTMTASVRLADTPVVDWSGHGGFTVVYAFEFWAADPLRYGGASTLETGFPVLAGGLEFDLFTDGTTDTGFLEFGAESSLGRITASNEGTADSWPQFTVTGPVPAFQIVEVESGRRLVFSRAVNAGDVLVIDSATGTVVLNGGDVDYSGYLTTAEWAPIPAGGSASFAFLPVSGAGTGTLAVTWRPAWW